MVIAGATATGKTALSLALATRLEGAEVVSADSRQVYRGLDIGTAKPTPAERAAVVHHGLDLADPDEPFSAADYRAAALESLHGIAARGGLALPVGGTGLYLRAVAHGLPLDRAGHDERVRAQLEARLRDEGLETLVAELRARDPAGGAGVDLRNPRRVVRALERTILSGTAAPPRPVGYPAPVLWLGLALEREEHRRRIRARIDEQFESGLLDEAARLQARYPGDLPAFSAMGYREAFAVLAGRSTVDEAKAADADRTWAYARRQRTWFRAEPAIEWLAAGEGVAEAAWAVLDPWLRRISHSDYAGRR